MTQEQEMVRDEYLVASGILFELKINLQGLDKDLDKVLHSTYVDVYEDLNDKLKVGLQYKGPHFPLKEASDGVDLGLYTTDCCDKLDIDTNVDDADNINFVYNALGEIYYQLTGRFASTEYTLSSANVGQWLDDYKILGRKDAVYGNIFLPYELDNSREPLVPSYLDSVDGRVYPFEIVPDHIDEENLDDEDKKVLEGIVSKVYEYQLNDVWNEDYEDYATIYANVHNYLEENNAKNLYIAAYKGKKFYIFNDVIDIAYEVDGFTNEAMLEIGNDPKVVEGLKELLISFKEGLIEGMKDEVGEKFQEYLDNKTYEA